MQVYVKVYASVCSVCYLLFSMAQFKGAMEITEITLLDAETDKEYTILLSEDDFNKATTDMKFAAELLENAKNNSKENNFNVENILANQTEGFIAGTSTFDDCDGDSGADDEGVSNRWSNDAVKLLLSIYEEKEHVLYKGKMRPNIFWDKIAKAMNEKQYVFNGIQCRTKMGTLKRQYKKVKDHNRQSGNARKDWPFLDAMDSLFGKKPWVEPLTTASSSHVEDQSPHSDKKENVPVACPKSMKAKRTDKTTKVVDLLQKIREDRERHHKERMEKQSEALNLLKKLVEKK